MFHSDYFSGWDEDKLQHVLDNCDNDSEAAMPNAFRSDFLTFRGKGKVEGVQVDDFDIRDDLEKIQPGPIDIKGLISPEDVTGVPELPRGVCSGELIAASNATTSAPTTFAGEVEEMSNNPILSTRCHYLCCQRKNQKGGAGEQRGKLPVQDKRSCQVRSQREVLGHLQEARKLQEDESVL